MHIETIWIRNFRRLKDARIDLASDISIFVGANNSGKTSAAHALQLFTAASRDRFSLHDFSSECGAEYLLKVLLPRHGALYRQHLLASTRTEGDAVSARRGLQRPERAGLGACSAG